MNILKEELVDFQIVHMDPIGDIYEYRNGIIRIIQNSYKNYVKQLLKSGLIDRLVEEHLLVETHLSNDMFEDRIILEHKRITPRQLYSQWTFSMMRDAALLVLKMNMVCMKFGYELKDCHQDNILFDGTRPVYVDFGSIVKRNKKSAGRGWIARSGFMECYYYPLKLWSKGYENTINALMLCGHIELRELIKMYYHVPIKTADSILSVKAVLPEKKAESELKDFFIKMNTLRYHGNTQWINYQDSYWEEGSNRRFDYEIEWINNREDIETMLEIGANQGFFSFLAATRTKIKKIISTDYDKGAVDIMYQRLKEEKSHNNKITPLIFDFVWPLEEEINALRSDLIVANALTHHLLLSQRMSMKAIADRLAVLSNKYVIVEFMENGIYKRKKDLPGWYTLDNFVKSMEDRFSDINIQQVEKGRTMITGLKRINKTV